MKVTINRAKAHSVMSKVFCSIIAFTLLSLPMYAEKVSVEKAGKVAQTQLNGMSQLRSQKQLKLRHTRKQASSPQRGLRVAPQEETPVYYVFETANNEGFVIVSGDDIAKPILGYSTSGTYDESNPNFKYWMDCLAQEIEWAVENSIPQSTETSAEWEIFSSGNMGTLHAAAVVAPLLETQWSQSAPYNNLCPIDGASRSLTGCVATAMAQIMKYHNYPTTRTTTIPGYTTSTKSIVVSEITGSTAYDWGNMTNTYSSSTASNPANDAVATLMYHCGVSVEMDYSSTDGSGAISRQVGTSLINYFGYDQSIQNKTRQVYKPALWDAIIKSEIDQERPVLYGGTGSEGGHAFVCDGYDNTGNFHFNWGWGGYQDGYFPTTALNTTNGTYNQGQSITINIKPNAGGTASYEINLFESLSATKTSVLAGESFSVTTKILNYGFSALASPATAKLELIDINDNQIIGTLASISLDGLVANKARTATRTCNIPNNIASGNYYIRVLFSPTNQSPWTFVSGGESVIDALPITVINNNPPTVTTQAATNITQSSATLNKTVTAGTETITAQGFEYKKTSESSWITVETTSTSYNLTGLTGDTQYQFYAYATTASGTVNGSTLTFTTTGSTATDYSPYRESEHFIFDIPDSYLIGNITPENLGRWMQHMDEVYDAYTVLVGHTPCNGQKLTFVASEDSYGEFWVYGGSPYVYWNDDWIVSNLQEINDNDSWNFGPMHEIGHLFDKEQEPNWFFHAEITANLKAIYAIDVLPDCNYELDGYKYSLQNIYDYFYNCSIQDDGDDDRYTDKITLAFINVARQYGWGVFTKTFNSYWDNSYPHTGCYDKYNDFVDRLEYFSGSADIRSECFNVNNWLATIEQHYPRTSQYEGTCGANLTWTLSCGMLTISGTGAMDDFPPFENYRSSITTVVIEDGVTSIGEQAFSWCSNLTSISIPNSITSIGNWAFYNCSTLQSVTNLATTPQNINSEAFGGVNISDILLNVPACSVAAYQSAPVWNSFAQIVGVGNVVPPTVTTQDASNVTQTSATLNKIVTAGCETIVAQGFKYKKASESEWSDSDGNLTNLESNTPYQFYAYATTASGTVNGSPSTFTTLPLPPPPCPNGTTGTLAWELCDGTLTISGSGAMPNYDYASNPAPWYSNKENIKTVVIQNGVTSIGINAFAYHSNLTSLIIPNSIKRIEGWAFTTSGLTSVTIPISVTSIGEGAFDRCYGLTSVTIPESVTNIEKWTFAHCNGLSSVTISSSATSIGIEAFLNCSGLTSVTIPNSVTSIGDGAFSGCTALKSVTNLATTPQSINSNVFDSVNKQTCALNVPACEVATYQSAAVWEDFANIVGVGVCETGIENLQNQGISIYPNPAKDEITIRTEQPIEKVEIVSIAGRVVASTNSTIVSVSHLPKGVYLVRITLDGQSVVKKIIKE